MPPDDRGGHHRAEPLIDDAGSPPANAATWANRATLCSTNTSRGRTISPRPAPATTCIEEIEESPPGRRTNHPPRPARLQHLGVDPGQNLLDRIGRRPVLIGVLILRGRQRTASRLPLTVSGNASSDTTAARNHVGGQPFRQLGADLGGVATTRHIAHQPFITRGDPRGRSPPRSRPPQPGQRAPGSPQLDAIPADLDLLISATHILQFALGVPAHQIPGAIHPRAGRPNGHATNRSHSNPDDPDTPPPNHHRPHTTHRPPHRGRAQPPSSTKNPNGPAAPRSETPPAPHRHR